jgi:ankyrin repeat protein
MKQPIFLLVVLLWLAIPCSLTQAQESGELTPLERAIIADNPKLLAELLVTDAKTELAGSSGFNLLRRSLVNSTADTTRLLLEHGAMPTHGSMQLLLLVEALTRDATTWQNKKMADLLIRYGADVNARFDPDVITELESLEGKQPVPPDDDPTLELLDQATLLMLTTKADSEIAAFLIEKGADPNATSRNGYTALSFAVEWFLDLAENRYKERVLFLLSNGVNPKQKIRISRQNYELAPLRNIDFNFVDLASALDDREFNRALAAVGIKVSHNRVATPLVKALRSIIPDSGHDSDAPLPQNQQELMVSE